MLDTNGHKASMRVSVWLWWRHFVETLLRNYQTAWFIYACGKFSIHMIQFSNSFHKSFGCWNHPTVKMFIHHLWHCVFPNFYLLYFSFFWDLFVETLCIIHSYKSEFLWWHQRRKKPSQPTLQRMNFLPLYFYMSTSTRVFARKCNSPEMLLLICFHPADFCYWPTTFQSIIE